MGLTPYGRREWLAITVVAALLAAVVFWLGWWWLLAPVVAAWLAGLAFFRDPARPIPTGLSPGAMLSPADGTVSAVERVDAHDATGGGPAVVVRIFLSVLNVHVNRAPCDGEVVAVRTREGRYHDARTPESAVENASVLTTIRLASGETVGVRQVVGKVARRIVCPLRPGDRVRRGERFGMIKLGSTTELALPRPDDVRVHVSTGDPVRGGLTTLATLAPRDAAPQEATDAASLAR